MSGATAGRRLDWLDPLKAFALMGILLNHIVEEFGPGPWFTNPSNDWPDLATRLRSVFPGDANPALAALRFLGWLGDSGPGVFILVSGVGLAYAAASRPAGEASASAFYRRRLLRLFPLYVAMHLLVLALALLVPGNTDTLAGPRGLLSLLGLRFTPDLFFHISPSWWFVWLILQLYLVFPLLHRLLTRLGIAWFLVVTIAITIAARGYGIMFSDHRYFWMTGLFFGTRLAEFAAGMVIGDLLARDVAMPRGSRVLAAGAILYLGGFAGSLTLPGSLISNLLVTLGLSALGYAAWAAIRGNPAAARAVLWTGAVSYPVFLLHHPPLLWTGAFLPGNTAAHVLAAAGTLVLVFPAAWGIDRGVDRLLRMPASERDALVMRLLALVAALGVFAVLWAIEPSLSFGSRRHRAVAVALGAWVMLIGLVEARVAGTVAERLLRRSALVAGALAAWFVAPGAGDFVLLAAVGLVLVQALLVRRVVRTALPAALITLVLGVAALAGAEALLRRVAPVEAGRWGELPALMAHDTRVYGLRPNADIRLRYNDYDYVLRTNSLGLAGPEIDTARSRPDALRILVLGDAFSMPEGVPYPRAWPARVEAALTSCLAPRPAQVINGGVTGYGPNESAAQLRDLAPLFRPDVVIYQFFVNEFWDAGVSPAERREDIGLTRRPRRHGLDLSRLQLVARLHRARAGIAKALGYGPDPDYDRSLASFYRLGDNEIYSVDRRQAVARALDQMRRDAESVAAPLIVFLVPAAIAVERPEDIGYYPAGLDLRPAAGYDLDRPLRELNAIADSLRIPVVDLAPLLRAHSEHPLYFRTAWHWNETGHGVVAHAMVEHLAGAGLLGAGACRSAAARP